MYRDVWGVRVGWMGVYEETNGGSPNFNLLRNDLPWGDLSTPAVPLSLPIFLGGNFQPNRKGLFPFLSILVNCHP